MLKEIGIGVSIAIALFAALQGINILPLFLLVGLGYMAYNLSGFKILQKGFNVKKTTTSLSVSFDDIGGQGSAKKEIKEALEFIDNRINVKHLGIRPLKGILLVGPPGTGKTLLAKAAATFTAASFLATSGSEFVEMYAGVGAQRVRDLFRRAREIAKGEQKKNAVIFIDEIDVLGGKRGQNTGHLEYDQTLNQLLVEMDGITSGDEIRVLVIAATNRADLLDKALLRPGRFDRIIQVDLPDKKARLQILKLHTRNKPLAPDVDLAYIAQQTFGFAGAHLENLANEAAILALREGKEEVSNHHFIDAIDKVIMGEKLDRRPNKSELQRIAIHETGHALLSENNRPGSVSVITIVSRGGALGYMRQTPEDDSFLMTKEQIEARIRVLIAGALAEEKLLQSRSTGASSDFKEAAKLAQQMVLSGMSHIGIVDPNNLPQSILHRAVVCILQEQETLVKELLTAQIDQLQVIANELLVEEKMTGDRFRFLLTNRDKLLQPKTAC